MEAMLQPISFYHFAISAPRDRTFLTSARGKLLISVGLVVLLHLALLLVWMLLPPSQPAPIKEMMVEIAMPLAAQPEVPAAPPPPVPVPQPRRVIEPAPTPAPTPVQVQERPSEAPVVQPSVPVVQPVAPVQAAAAPAPAVVAPPPPPLPDVEPDYKASYLNNAQPSYPYAARRMGLEGKVVLNVEVLAEGLAGQVNVFQSSGHEILDNAAVQAVKGWKFVPARQAGRAITKWFKVPIQFKLTNKSEA